MWSLRNNPGACLFSPPRLNPREQDVNPKTNDPLLNLRYANQQLSKTGRAFCRQTHSLLIHDWSLGKSIYFGRSVSVPKGCFTRKIAREPDISYCGDIVYYYVLYTIRRHRPLHCTCNGRLHYFNCQPIILPRWLVVLWIITPYELFSIAHASQSPTMVEVPQRTKTILMAGGAHVPRQPELGQRVRTPAKILVLLEVRLNSHVEDRVIGPHDFPILG